MLRTSTRLLLLAFVALLLGCRQHDWRELVLHVPDIHDDASVQHVMQALSRAPGIKPGSVVVDLENRRIGLLYDSLEAADMNYVHLVARAGFEVNGIPADETARAALPPGILP